MTHKELQKMYINMLEENDLQIKYGLPETLPAAMATHMKAQVIALEKMPHNEQIANYAQFDTVPAWDASEQYHIGDAVRHEGTMWKATSNNSNNEPDDVPGDWEAVQ